MALFSDRQHRAMKARPACLVMNDVTLHAFMSKLFGLSVLNRFFLLQSVLELCALALYDTGEQSAISRTQDTSSKRHT